MMMSRPENGFVAVIDKQQTNFDWNKIEIGLALHHPLRGIIAETIIHVNN